MVAANKIQKNSISAAFLCFIQFGLLCILFRIGLDAIWARILGVVFTAIWSFVVKPYILWRDINYTWNELFRCIFRSMRSFVIVAIICYVLYVLIPQTTIIRSLLLAATMGV